MLPPPIGFITLGEAVEMVRRKALDAERAIAEGCESGVIAAAYRSVTGGADDLDRLVWQLPHWRDYFATGEIDLELALLDDQCRPVSDGRTAHCTREIFIRREGFERFVAQLAGPKGKGGRPPKFDRAVVAAEVHRLMVHHGEFSADDPEWNGQARLIEALRQRFGEASDSTFEEYIKEPLATWRSGTRR
jgi:hypothetical protein